MKILMRLRGLLAAGCLLLPARLAAGGFVSFPPVLDPRAPLLSERLTVP